MRRIFSCALLAIILLASMSPVIPAQKASKKTADLVFRNGAVYTLDASRRWAEAVAVSRGRIVYVGTARGVGSWIGPRTVVVDLQGKMLLPSFHDSHVHPVSGGIELGECQLSELATVEQILEAVRRYAEQNPQKPWIRGSGWQLPIFADANPHKSLLDKVVANRPVFLTAADGHSAWVNSRALEVARITRETPDPKPGRIERDPKTSEPTGTLREDAMRLVARHLPEYTPDDYLNGLRRALEMANRFGITSLQDAAVNEAELNAYAALDRRGELTARVVAALHVEPSKGVSQIPRLIAMRQKYQGRRLRAIATKIFADGVIEARTAALLEPYLETPGDRGKANGAYVNFEERETGSIEVGKAADLIVLDRNLFEIPAHEIHQAKVLLTLLEGKAVYRDASFALQR